MRKETKRRLGDIAWMVWRTALILFAGVTAFMFYGSVILLVMAIAGDPDMTVSKAACTLMQSTFNAAIAIVLLILHDVQSASRLSLRKFEDSVERARDWLDRIERTL